MTKLPPESLTLTCYGVPRNRVRSEAYRFACRPRCCRTSPGRHNHCRNRAGRGRMPGVQRTSGRLRMGTSGNRRSFAQRAGTAWSTYVLHCCCARGSHRICTPQATQVVAAWCNRTCRLDHRSSGSRNILRSLNPQPAGRRARRSHHHRQRHGNPLSNRRAGQGRIRFHPLGFQGSRHAQPIE